MLKSALLLSSEALTQVYGGSVRERLFAMCGRPLVIAPAHDWRAQSRALEDVEVIFSGWGAPRMDESFLKHLPSLRAVFYGGGSIRYFITDEFWRRGVRLTTAQAVNAIPVAEFTVSAILLGLKRLWHFARQTRELRDFPLDRPLSGAYRSTVGLVSYGTIARLVREKLRSLEVNVIVYDPFLGKDEAASENVENVALDELFAKADAVSVHTPSLSETACLIKGRHFERMKPDAFFLNTARGEVVDEAAMIDVLRRRADLQVVLDVTSPEPPSPSSPLYSLPNVVLTPHIAGSVGPECLRMGHAMLDEFERYRAGQPLRWEITADRARLIA